MSSRQRKSPKQASSGQQSGQQLPHRSQHLKDEKDYLDGFGILVIGSQTNTTPPLQQSQNGLEVFMNQLKMPSMQYQRQYQMPRISGIQHRSLKKMVSGMLKLI